MVAGVFCNRLYALHADNWEKREVKGHQFKAFPLNQTSAFERETCGDIRGGRSKVPL